MAIFHKSRFKTVLLMLVFFLVTIVLAESLPTGDDINRLAENAKLITDQFIQDSFYLRAELEYSGRFNSQENRDKFITIAQRARGKLESIGAQQRTLIEQIEGYQSSDWDSRYGANGLWRKLAGDISVTSLSVCEIDFYLASAAQQPARNEILHKILVRINDQGTDNLPIAFKLLRAKTLGLLSQTDSAYKSQAKKEFDLLTIRSDMLQEMAFRITIEAIRFLGEAEAGRLNRLTDELSQSSCSNDMELVLSLAFLQRRYCPEGFERTVTIWPQIEDLLGRLALSEISERFKQQQGLEQIWLFEAKLAAKAIWRNQADKCVELLDYLANTQRFKTPLILYAAGSASVDSLPIKSVNFLTEASKLQKLHKDSMLKISAEKIARQAAMLGYNLYTADRQNCSVALEAMDNYQEMAGEKIDGELEYLYTIVLNDCGEAQKSRHLLEKIVSRPAGKWRDRAKLDLIMQEIRQIQNDNERPQGEILEQLAHHMSLAVRLDSGSLAGEVNQLLLDIVDAIDLLQIQADDFETMLEDCEKLALFNYKCLDDRESGLLLAEISVFAAKKDEEKLSAVEKLLENLSKDGKEADVNLLRCRARLVTEQGRFNQAAELWAKICNIRKNQISAQNQRSWKWWRAKFFETACWARMPQTKKENVLHSIEILENSFSDIPPLWAEKLRSLRQQCRAELIGEGK